MRRIVVRLVLQRDAGVGRRIGGGVKRHLGLVRVSTTAVARVRAPQDDRVAATSEYGQAGFGVGAVGL